MSYADRNCWTCPGCEQYNGFTEDGDYNRDLDLTSGSGVRFASSQNKSGVGTGNGLCHQCNLNQVKLLISFGFTLFSFVFHQLKYFLSLGCQDEGFKQLPVLQ